MLLTFTERGICCPAAGLYVDPWKPVDRAIITHAHSDHARAGHGRYLASRLAVPVMRHRLGEIAVDALDYGEAVTVNGVRISLHPAGHIPGSAQVRLEYRGEVWVVSGDYKLEADALSTPFEPVRCHAFVSECTFGLPAFRWRPQEEVFGDIDTWWAGNAAAGRVSVIGAYALGKAQRLIAGVDTGFGPILTHGAVESTNEVLRAQGLPLPATRRVAEVSNRKDLAGALVVAPPSALGTNWMRRLGETSTAFASGWMALRGVRRRRAADRGFVMSDHADWPALDTAIRATGAERIFVTHGYTQAFRRWLTEQGFDAEIVSTEFEGEQFEQASPPGELSDDAEAGAAP